MRATRKLAQLGLLAAAVLGTGYLFAFGPSAERAPAPAPQPAGTTTRVDGVRSPDTLHTLPGSEHRPPGKDIPAAVAAAGAERPATNDDDATTAAAIRGPGIVRLNFMGRLGNNLFEYAAARALADRLGFALSVQPAPYNRKKFGLLTRPEGMACFPGVRPVGPAPSSPEMVGLETVKFRGIRRELQDPKPRSIEMEGWFQDYSMFRSEKERLRKVSSV
ncbi:unnamed protein product, partial [Ectocarpus fasciculatus]